MHLPYRGRGITGGVGWGGEGCKKACTSLRFRLCAYLLTISCSLQVALAVGWVGVGGSRNKVLIASLDLCFVVLSKLSRATCSTLWDVTRYSCCGLHLNKHLGLASVLSAFARFRCLAMQKLQEPRKSV